MRITHVISNLDIGGAETSLCVLVEAMREMPVEHSVVSLMPRGVLAPRLRAANAHVIELGARRSLWTAAKLRRVGQAVAATKPDVIQGWMYHGNVAASAAALVGYSRAPILWGVRQTLYRLSDNRLPTRFVILASGALAFQPHRILYNSALGAAQHARVGYPRSKEVVLPNAVDCERFRPRPEAAQRVRRELGLDPSTRLIGRVGRNAAMKGNDSLIKAFARIARVEPKAHLVLIGPGMTEDDRLLSARLWDAGLSGRVHRLGFRLDIEQFYPAFDLVISSSQNSEGFPNVVAEAAASGTPVVATDIGETRTILQDNGLLTPPGDADALAEAAIKVLAKPDDERGSLGAALRQSVVSRFEAHAVMPRYLDIWQQAAAEAGAARLGCGERVAPQ